LEDVVSFKLERIFMVDHWLMFVHWRKSSPHGHFG